MLHGPLRSGFTMDPPEPSSVLFGRRSDGRIVLPNPQRLFEQRMGRSSSSVRDGHRRHDPYHDPIPVSAKRRRVDERAHYQERSHRSRAYSSPAPHAHFFDTNGHQPHGQHALTSPTTLHSERQDPDTQFPRSIPPEGSMGAPRSPPSAQTTPTTLHPSPIDTASARRRGDSFVREKPRRATGLSSRPPPTEAPATLRLTFKLLQETTTTMVEEPPRRNRSRNSSDSSSVSADDSIDAGVADIQASALSRSRSGSRAEGEAHSPSDSAGSRPPSTPGRTKPRRPRSPLTTTLSTVPTKDPVFRCVTVMREVPPLQRSRKQVYQTLEQFTSEQGLDEEQGGDQESRKRAASGSETAAPFRIYVHQAKGKKDKG